MYKNIFNEWYMNFKSHKLFKSMVDTVEDSPFHREKNVGVHTDMVVNEYIQRSPTQWTKQDFIGAIQCAIHDIGKPRCEEEVVRSDGSVYRRYKGHELMSQRMFTDYILSNDGKELREYLDNSDIYNIGYIAQYHLPYQLGNERLEWIRQHLCHYGLEEIFIRCLRSDTYGRISDDAEEKHMRLENWITSTYYGTQLKIQGYNENKTEVVLLVAPTGAGKSTYMKNNLNDYAAHSMDQLRLDWYDSNDYTAAFKMSCADNNFNNKAMKHFVELVKEHDKVVVDNTNIKPKNRKKYLKNTSHHKVAVVFLTTYDTNYQRLLQRTDKYIPMDVLDRMYWSLILPSIGEVDEIIMEIAYDE